MFPDNAESKCITKFRDPKLKYENPVTATNEIVRSSFHMLTIFPYFAGMSFQIIACELLIFDSITLSYFTILLFCLTSAR